ncbi:MAG: biotin transporter BioY [Actinobacteria bacterium]|nr:biotin transporter BioY [Actinomycetota bacterium]
MSKDRVVAALEATGTAIYSDSKKLAMKLAFSIIFAVLMAVSANSFIYLPFTPVPMTMQVLTVIFSAIVLGGPWAMTGQLIYISMGLAGLPVFAGFKGGPMVLAGPTAGYIIGFAAAAYFCGSLYQNLKTKRLMPSASSLLAGFFSCIAGIMIIYLFGYVHLFGFLFSLFPGQTVSDIMLKTWKSGIEPFIIIDLLKILIIINVLELGKKRKWKL